MIAKLGDALNRFAHRFVPDPFVLAFALTGIVFVASFALLWSESGAGAVDITAELGRGWLGGFSSAALLGFALQMCLVLVTGHALAMSEPVQSVVRRLAAVPQSAGQAAAIVAAVACAAAIVHWGLGAIVGAFLAREIGRHANGRGLALHYPILGAAAYAGMAVWHGGLSGSAPTKVAESGELGLGELLLSPLNVAVTGSLIVLIPLLFWLLTPREADAMVAPPELSPSAEVAQAAKARGIAATAIGAGGLLAVIALIVLSTARLEINTINAIFFFTGLGLVGRFDRYVELIAEGARGAGAIIIQFPLYFGILGLMKASGMVAWLSGGLVSIGSKTTLPILDFLSAGAVNLAIPSGGGQWAVQRDILLGAGDAVGVDPTTTILAFSYGDAWTNMLQPFWALPLLGIMGLKAKDIIGYTATVFLLMGIVVPVWLVVLG